MPTESKTMLKLLEEVSRGEARRMLVPAEMSVGWPSISIKQQNICVLVPFYLARRAQEGRTLLYPISYSMLLLLENGIVVNFTRHSYTKGFEDVDYAKPVGTFPHPSVEGMDRESYARARDTLFGYYDGLIDAIRQKKAFDELEAMRALFTRMMEPPMLPMYERIAPKFFQTYCKQPAGA